MQINGIKASKGIIGFNHLNSYGRITNRLTSKRREKNLNSEELTIVMPTYNRAELLEANIENLLGSTHKFELLIIDDASTDNTREIVKKFGDPRITYIKHELNLGYPKSLNEGIAKAKNDNILFCEDDVFILHPNEFLKIIVDELCFKSIVATRRLENGKEIKLNLAKKIKRFFSEPLAGEVYGYYGYKRRYIPFCNNCFAFNRRDIESRFEISTFEGNVFRIESDFHIRSRREGATIVYNPRLVVDHRRYNKGGLRVRDPDDFLYQCMVNHMKYLKRNYLKVKIFLYIFFKLLAHPTKIRTIKKAIESFFGSTQPAKDNHRS